MGAVGGALSAGASALAGKPKAPEFKPFSFEARERTQVLKSPIAARRIIYGTALVGGALVYATSSGASKEYMHMVIPVAGHEVEAIGDIYFNDKLATDDRFKDHWRVNKHVGTADQAADADLMAESSEWTADHRLRGTAYLYVRLKWNPDVWPMGMPNIGAVVQGRKVYDPRIGQWVFSNNPALCIRDYLTQDFGLGATGAEIDEATFIAAANACDEMVTLKDGGTQKRYTLDGSFTLDAQPIQVMEDMLTACAGVLVYTQGRYRLFAGIEATATDTLTADHLRGPVKVRPRIGRRELYNSVRGTFVDPAKSWQPADFPLVTNPLYQTQDGGQQIWRDIELPFTTDSTRAQRIAKIHLEMSRQGVTVEFPATLAALKVAVWDVVRLTLADLGWNEKPFRVMGWTLAEDGGVDLVLQEYSSASYAWNAGDATTYDPAPDTQLPSPWEVAPPPGLTVTEQLYVTRAGDGVKAKAVLGWLASTGPFVDLYQVEYRAVGESEWQVAGRTSALQFELADLAPAKYDFRVKTLNTLGVSGGYATLQQEIFGLLAPPSPVTGLNLSAISSLAVLNWDKHPDLDVIMGGGFRVRHSAVTAGASWQSAVDIGPAIAGGSTNVTLPLLAGTYLIKAVDSSGRASLTAATINTNAPTLVNFTNLHTLQEAPLFPGAKVEVMAEGGKLFLTGTGLFDAITDFDALADLDSWGGIDPVGTYSFASGIDLGTVKTVRLTSAIEALVINTNDRIDSRPNAVDSWDDFDGTASASADCQVQMRSTDDNPSGSPAWSEWRRLTIADYRARAFQFRAVLTTSDPAFNIELSQLTVTADEVA